MTSTLQAAVNPGSHTQWLVLIRPQGVMEVFLFEPSINNCVQDFADMDAS